jgi:hypothetical protein
MSIVIMRLTIGQYTGTDIYFLYNQIIIHIRLTPVRKQAQHELRIHIVSILYGSMIIMIA